MATFSTAMRNASAGAQVALLDGGTLELLTAADAVVSSHALATPAFGAPVTGVATGNAVGSDIAAGGTIAKARLRNSASGIEVDDLTVTLAGGGGDVIVQALAPGEGVTVTIDSLTFTAPAS